MDVRGACGLRPRCDGVELDVKFVHARYSRTPMYNIRSATLSFHVHVYSPPSAPAGRRRFLRVVLLLLLLLVVLVLQHLVLIALLGERIDEVTQIGVQLRHRHLGWGDGRHAIRTVVAVVVAIRDASVAIEAHVLRRVGEAAIDVVTVLLLLLLIVVVVVVIVVIVVVVVVIVVVVVVVVVVVALAPPAARAAC